MPAKCHATHDVSLENKAVFVDINYCSVDFCHYLLDKHDGRPNEFCVNQVFVLSHSTHVFHAFFSFILSL